MNDELQLRARPLRMIAPLAVLALFLCLLAAILYFPAPLPLGPHYPELGVWLDAAHRIAAGQLPGLDFSAPAGPLGYQLFELVQRWLPQAHPLLAAQWSVLAVTAPLMALLVIDVAPRSRVIAWGLLLPFLLFSTLPFNLAPALPGPGMDAYGIHGRQAAHLVFMVAAALIFMRNPLLLALVLGLSLTALFLLKLGAFAAGTVVLVHAMLAGRMRWSVLFGLLVIFYGLLGWAEYSLGFVSAYLQDAILVWKDSAPGVIAAGKAALHAHAALLAAVLLLLLLVLWFSRRRLSYIYSENVTYLGRRRAIHAIFDTPAAWIVALALAFLVLGSVTPAGHAQLVLWPGVLLALRKLDRFEGGRRFAIATLCAAIVLPGLMQLLERAAATIAAAPDQVVLQTERLGAFGLVSAEAGLVAEAERLGQHFQRHRRAWLALAEEGARLEPGRADPLVWMRELDRLVSAIEAWEREQDRRLATLHLADRSNPLPALLAREPLRFARIGAEVGQDFTRESPHWLQSLQEADAILLPHCPETAKRLAMRARLMPALEGRQAIAITPCFTLMLRREPAETSRVRHSPDSG